MDYNGLIFTSKSLLFYTFLFRLYYFILNKTLNNYDIYYKLPVHKKQYIVKNIVKSINLFYLVLNYQIIQNIYYNIENIRPIQYYATIYIANDFLGLLYVKKLPNTTKIHHIISTFLLFIVATISNPHLLIYKYIYSYTICSYHAFLVNLYLGLRFFYGNNNYLNKFVDCIRVFSYYNYSICLIVNVFIHAYLTIKYNNDLNLLCIFYLFIVIPIIRDDMILLSWLKQKKID